MSFAVLQFSLYLALMLGIGYYSMRKTNNNDDFLIGDRTLGPVTTTSAGASDMSSWLLLGLAGATNCRVLPRRPWC